MMKRLRKIFAYAIALSIVLCGTVGINHAPADKQSSAYAAEETIELSNGMTFTTRLRNGNTVSGEITLISYTGSSSDIVIPQSIDGLNVTAIGDNVFKENKVIRSVKLPDTINYFGESVFQDSSVTSVNIPKKLRIIPDNTFIGCSDLDNVTFHEDIVIIGKTAFNNTGVTVPDELVDVCNNKIRNSDSLIDVNENGWYIYLQNDKVTGDLSSRVYTFYSDNTDIVVPDNYHGVPISDFNIFAIKESSKVTSVVFSAGLEEIPFNFSNRPELRSITFLGDKIKYVGGFSNTGIEELFLPAMEEVGVSAFSGCESLRKVTLSGDAEALDIGREAFRGCTALEEVTFPEKTSSVTINRSAFENSRITEVKLKGASEIGPYAFNKCGELDSLVLSGDSHISSLAFRDCKSLKTITFGGIPELEANAFSGCKALESITLDTTRTINGSAFDGCTRLMNIGSEPAFDSETSDLRDDIKDFILTSFNAADDVGFINQYVKAQAEKVVSEYTDDSMSDMQKIKILHDWVCNNTVYNHDDTNAPESHNDAALFMNDTAVCEGYTKALNLLLNAAGIETYYVHSSDHAWNVVKLGGHYFHVDTTWDDGDTVSYDWFLKSDSELKAAGGSHEKWSLFTPSSLHSFQGSVLPECEYQMGDLNTDGSVDGGDLRLLQDYILGKAPVSADDIVLADLNHDGVTDVFDLISMRRLINEN